MRKMYLTTPLQIEDVRRLKVGEIVYLSGRVCTARDKAHERALKLDSFPKTDVLFHSGPLVRERGGGWEMVSIGPTSSSRMNSLEPEFIKRFGIKAVIGKGGMGGAVVEAMRGKTVYLAMTGGCAAITASRVKKIVDVLWLDLGVPEAVWVLDVNKLGPLVVAIDCNGHSIYK